MPNDSYLNYIYILLKELFSCFFTTFLIYILLVYSQNITQNNIIANNFLLSIIKWDLVLLFLVGIFLPFLLRNVINNINQVYNDSSSCSGSHIKHNTFTENGVQCTFRYDEKLLSIGNKSLDTLYIRIDLFCALFVMFFMWRAVYDRSVRFILSEYPLVIYNLNIYASTTFLLFLVREYFARRMVSIKRNIIISSNFESMFAEVLQWNIRKDWVLSLFIFLQNYYINKFRYYSEEIYDILNLIMLLIITSVSVRLTKMILYRQINF